MSTEPFLSETAPRLMGSSPGTMTMNLNLLGQAPRRVLACGCFDLLHVGHLRLLKAARKLGTTLIVGLNSDESVRALKGYDRPFLPQAERKEALEAVRWVDEVILFEEPTPEALIRQLRPAFYVKGAEYGVDGQDLPEQTIVEELGGQVIFFSMAPGRSTTALVDRIIHRRRP